LKRQLKAYLILLITFICVQLKAQDKTIDSLNLALKNAKHDTLKCQLLNVLMEYVQEEEWPIFNEQIELICKKQLNSLSKLNKEYKVYQRYYSTALLNSGVVFQGQNNYEKAIYNYSISLQISEQLNDLESCAYALNNIGYIYNYQGDLRNALVYLEKSLKIYEQIKDLQGIATTLTNIGVIYESQGDLTTTLSYYTKSLKIYNEIGDKGGLATSYNNIGYLNRKKGDLNKALANFNESLKIYQEIKDEKGIARSWNNIGFVYKDRGDLTKALEYSLRSLKLRESIKDVQGIAVSYHNVASIYFKQNAYKEAINLMNRSLSLSKEIGDSYCIKNASTGLYELYKKTGNTKLALQNYELYIKMRDSISNEETKNASIKSQLKYQYEKKATADSVKVVEEKKVVAAQLKQEKTQRYALYAGLCLVGLFALFMVNRFRVTNKQKKLIEAQKKIVEHQKQIVDEKQNEILDSIYYAKRIQTSLLPTEKYIDRILKNNKN
jgi:tetratricopeptide (TPR) repeat protein